MEMKQDTLSTFMVLPDLPCSEVEYPSDGDTAFVTRAAEGYGPRGKCQALKLINEIDGFAADRSLSQEDRDAVMLALQKAFFDCKEANKKFIPKRNRHIGE